jgi:hypothetical protein
VHAVQKVAPGAAVVVIKPTYAFVLLFIILFSTTNNAAVLPEERADVLYHSYDGGGISINGPAVLVRTSVGDSVSVSAKHYVDTISSASIDVEVILGASTYNEERVENSFSLDFLNEKTLMSVNYTNSVENDFTANTFSLAMSQDVFGDLTTVSIGYAHGDNSVGKTGTPSFAKESQTDNFKLSLVQVLTKNLIMSTALEVITDAGYLNNPYRKVRYIDPGDSSKFLLENEVYPETRTSTAIAVRARYFLAYRAALHAEYRTFQDSWGIVANNFEVGYTHPFANNWIADVHFRSYAQTKARFYNDLFPYSNAQNFLARDKELSSFNDTAIGFGLSYEFAKSEGGFIEKASINFKYDYIRFNYKNFRDARQTSYTPGTEPLYKFNTNVMQLFVSVWF